MILSSQIREALLNIACTLPVTSCECERSFSAMRRLRTWLRSSMTMNRMESIAIMNIHNYWRADHCLSKLGQFLLLFEC